MKVLLGATIALLALVSVGLAVYAYTEHRIDREVAQRAVTTPETAAYTDQQLYESRAEGPKA
jgi:hypothetical protein